MKRRNSRDLAFQLVYAMEMSGEDKDTVLRRFSAVSDKMDADESKYGLQLFEWTLDMIPDLNECLKPIIEHWSIERLSKVDKSLIYLGCSEIESSETPASVVIDEMVELAKVYGDKNSPSFINGIIDSWRKKR